MHLSIFAAIVPQHEVPRDWDSVQHPTVLRTDELDPDVVGPKFPTFSWQRQVCTRDHRYQKLPRRHIRVQPNYHRTSF